MLIVNFSDYGNKVHRLNEMFGDRWVYVGRWNKAGVNRSPLANPYYRKGNPGSTLKKYRRWLWNELQSGNKAVIDELLSLVDENILVCHCKNPEKCHASIIVKAAAWAKEYYL